LIINYFRDILALFFDFKGLFQQPRGKASMRPPSSEARGGSAAARGKRSVYGMRRIGKLVKLTALQS